MAASSNKGCCASSIQYLSHTTGRRERDRARDLTCLQKPPSSTINTSANAASRMCLVPARTRCSEIMWPLRAFVFWDESKKNEEKVNKTKPDECLFPRRFRCYIPANLSGPFLWLQQTPQERPHESQPKRHRSAPKRACGRGADLVLCRRLSIACIVFLVPSHHRQRRPSLRVFPRIPRT